MADKVIVDYQGPDGPVVTHVRSTLISSSLETLRGLSLYDRFVGLLPQEHHAELLYTFAPVWLPVGSAVAYYETWARLELSQDELERAGRTVSERIMGSFLATLLRSARVAGATPWIPLGQYDRLWMRIMRGGAVRIVEKGPKDALIETKGLPMLRSHYFRTAYRSLMMAAGGVFAKKLFLRDVPVTSPDACTVWASWV